MSYNKLMDKTVIVKKHSYGVLLHRRNENGEREIFLGAANGPRYWGTKHEKIWGLPKGRPENGEKPLETALREFEEEVGMPAPQSKYKLLFDYSTPHGKIITVFIAKAQNVKVTYGKSMLHKIEWPVGSGSYVTYRELSDARWFTKEDALNHVMWGQRGIVELFFAGQAIKDRKKELKRAAKLLRV